MPAKERSVCSICLARTYRDEECVCDDDGDAEVYEEVLAELRGCAIFRNPHTAVKPVAIMEWLIGLLCPAGGTVLDPWIGSGTTGVAAARRGREIIGVERESIYHEVATMRVDHAYAEAVTA